jgi:Coenzyme PQQ synthesis protein D (PqqD)
MGLQRSPEVTYEVVDGKAMLVDPAGRKLITLNRVGTLVWEALDGTLDVDQLTDQLLPRFTDVSRDELARDVAAFVQELAAADLILGAGPR